MVSRGWRRWPWLVLGGAGMASVALGVVGSAARGAELTVTGLSAVAVSNGMGQTMGDPNRQPYPTAKGDIAHTEATLSTGPTGYALASTAWPGPLVGNAGSLAVLLGAPPQASNANYNARAEAFSGGPNDAEAPGMTAHAKGGEAESTAGAQDFESSQGQTTGDVRTWSRSAFESNALRSVSSCTASDLGFAQGAVTIGSVRTEAEAVTNGTTGSSGGRTVVSGTKIGGQDAEVDEDGVRFTDPATAPIGEQVLKNFGISMFVAAPRHEEGSSSASHRAGSLVVIWDPPGTDYGYIYEICGSDAAVRVLLGSAYVFPPLVGPDLESVLPEAEVYTDPASSPFSSPTPTPSPTPQVEAPESLGPIPVGFVRDLSIWPYIIGMLSVIAAGIGLGRARDAALLPRATTVVCPLEGDHS